MKKMMMIACTTLGLSVMSGCSMCQNPFDYSGPTGNGTCPRCGFNHREGSILGAGGAPNVQYAPQPSYGPPTTTAPPVYPTNPTPAGR